MTLDESTDENDVIITSAEVKVVYEKAIDEYISDVKIDYNDDLYNKGFTMSGSSMSSC